MRHRNIKCNGIVTRLSIAPMVSITASGDTLTAHIAGAVSYQWSNDSVVFAADTLSTIVAVDTGTYYVTAFYTSGCQSSASYHYLTGIIEPATGNGISVYPNPTDGKILIDLNGTGFLSIKIFDALGRVVYNQPLNAVEQDQKLRLNINSAADGIYVLQAVTQQGTVSKRIVVRR